MRLVDQILSRVDELPAVPAIANQILAMASEPEYDFKRLMELVSMDPGITAHVLRMCNSPYFGLVNKVSSLEQALSLLGTNHLVEIVLSSKMVSMFRHSQDGYRMARGELWRHSMATALLAQRLGRKVGHKSPATLFTAGLLHDVGKLILSEYVGDKFQAIEALVRDEGKSFVQAEREILGVDHALLGAAAARRWNFPETITHAIAFHHDLEHSQKHRGTARLVALANLMVVSMGVGGGAEGLAASVPESLFAELKLKSRDLEGFALELKNILDQADELLAMAQ